MGCGKRGRLQRWRDRSPLDSHSTQDRAERGSWPLELSFTRSLVGADRRPRPLVNLAWRQRLRRWASIRLARTGPGESGLLTWTTPSSSPVRILPSVSLCLVPLMGLGHLALPPERGARDPYQVCLPRGSVSFFLPWPLSFADFLFLTQWAPVPWEFTLGWGQGRMV